MFTQLAKNFAAIVKCNSHYCLPDNSGCYPFSLISPPHSILVVREAVQIIYSRAPAFGTTFQIATITYRFQDRALGIKHLAALSAFYNCHISLSFQPDKLPISEAVGLASPVTPHKYNIINYSLSHES